MRGVALRCTVMRGVALRCTVMRGVALRRHRCPESLDEHARARTHTHTRARMRTRMHARSADAQAWPRACRQAHARGRTVLKTTGSSLHLAAPTRTECCVARTRRVALLQRPELCRNTTGCTVAAARGAPQPDGLHCCSGQSCAATRRVALVQRPEVCRNTTGCTDRWNHRGQLGPFGADQHRVLGAERDARGADCAQLQRRAAAAAVRGLQRAESGRGANHSNKGTSNTSNGTSNANNDIRTIRRTESAVKAR